MNKINLKMLRGAATKVVLTDDNGEDMELQLKPIPFKKFLELTEGFKGDIKKEDGSVDALATAQQNAKKLDEMLIQTFLVSYPEMNRDEIDADLQDVSSNNITTLIDNIMVINGLDDDKVPKLQPPTA